MLEAKNTARALVRIGYDGRVHKMFRGPSAKERFETEIRVLKYLEERGCDFVPRLLQTDEENLTIVTSNCGARVEQLSDAKTKEIFDQLEQFGVRHEDPFLRNITYRASDGRFCIIDFEFATITGPPTVVAPTSPDSVIQIAQTVQWSGMTHPGRFRPNNEDAFLALILDSRDVRYLGKVGEASLKGYDFVFAVSDGMGGEKSGEFASKIALEKITWLLPRKFSLSPQRLSSMFHEIMHELFDSIHRELTRLGIIYPECANMGATLSLGWVTRGWMYFGHIGDSRIYHFPKDGRMVQITEDHTHVGWLRRAGKINEREARSHPRKNMLAQSLGAGHQMLKPQIGAIRCQPGDRFLLCTDGLIEGLWDSSIEELVLSPPQSVAGMNTAARLVEASIRESGRDNVTAVVVELNS